MNSIPPTSAPHASNTPYGSHPVLLDLNSKAAPSFHSGDTQPQGGPPPLTEEMYRSFELEANQLATPQAQLIANNADSDLSEVQYLQRSNSADNADFDIEEDDIEKFPLGCLPLVPRRIVEEVSKAFLIPESLAAAVALGALSFSIGAGLSIKTDEISVLRGNLFIIVVAASGTGKGRAFTEIMKPFIEFETERVNEWRKEARPLLEAEMAVSKRQIEKLERTIGKRDGPISPDELDKLTSRRKRLSELEAQLHEPRLSVADITAEALAIALQQGKHETIASMSSEARGCADVLAGRYNRKTDESIYLAGFSGDGCKYDRIGRPSIHITRPCLGVLWMMQPDKFNELLAKSSLSDSGWLPRCLTFDSNALPQHLPQTRHVVDEKHRGEWARLVRDLLVNIHDIQNPSVLNPSPEVSDLLAQYTNTLVDARLPGGELFDVGPYVARWAELTWRMTLVLHAGLHGSGSLRQAVSVKTARESIQLMQWFSNQQLRLLSPGREEKKMERLNQLISLLSSEPEFTSTLRDLKRRHRFTKEEVSSLAAHYPTRLSISTVKPAGSGRPSVVVKLVTAP